MDFIFIFKDTSKARCFCYMLKAKSLYSTFGLNLYVYSFFSAGMVISYSYSYVKRTHFLALGFKTLGVSSELLFIISC